MKGIGVINIGGTSHDRRKRSINESILNNYIGHVTRKSLDAKDQGYKSIMLMNPCGYDEGFKDFDEAVEASINPYTKHLVGHFPQIIRDLNEEFDEVIVYLGSLAKDPHFLGLNHNDYLRRVRDSLLPFRGARIAIDAMSAFRNFEVTYHGEERTLLGVMDEMFGPLILEGKFNEKWTPEELEDFTNMYQYEIPPRDGDIEKEGSLVLIRPIEGVDVVEAEKKVLDQGNIPCRGV